MPYTMKSRNTPKMQRAHFDLIATMLRNSEPDRGNKFAPRGVQTKGAAAHKHWRETCEAFASGLASTNPRFRRADFLSACGVVED